MGELMEAATEVEEAKATEAEEAEAIGAVEMAVIEVAMAVIHEAIQIETVAAITAGETAAIAAGIVVHEGTAATTVVEKVATATREVVVDRRWMIPTLITSSTTHSTFHKPKSIAVCESRYNWIFDYGVKYLCSMVPHYAM